MTSQADLAIIRGAYAKQVSAAAQVGNLRLVNALATVRRETFLPPGPWTLWINGVAVGDTPDDDPLYLYQDITFPLLPAKGLNSGQPSFVAQMISLADIGDGDHVVHIGTGAGYYTALMSALAGPSGHVLGLEFEPELAGWAQRALAEVANTTIIQADGWTHALAPADAILVSAGAARFSSTWLDALKPGGRLVMPLAASYADGDRLMTRGRLFRIERVEDGFRAAAGPVTFIYPCWGGGDPGSEAALSAAFESKRADQVRRLRQDDLIDESRCWLRGEGWSLTYD